MRGKAATVALVISALMAGGAPVGLASAASSIEWASHPVNAWVKQSPREGAPAPQFSWEGSGAYDPYSRKWIHHGGHDGVPQGFVLFTWDVNSGAWEQRFPGTSPPGVCCVDGANVFDVANRRFVRFPGASLGHGWQWSRKVWLKDSAVWLYDPAANEWSNMRPAPYKEPAKYSKEVLGYLNAGGAYDPNHEVAISFGGQGSAGDMNNLFVYDAYTNRLERLAAVNPPSPRDGMGICYDSKNDCLVVFGSQYDTDERTWIYRYDTNRWQAYDLEPHPPGKRMGTYATIPKMAYDSANGICLLVNWLDAKGHETWAFDAEKLKWTQLHPLAQPEPSGSRARNLTYCPDLNVFILESWTHEHGPQIWTYRYRNRPRDDTPAAPTELKVTTEPGKALLTWTPSATPGVSEYHIYRARTDRPWLAEFALVGATRGTRFEEEGLEAGEACLYTVRAVGADGRESRDSPKARTQPRALAKLTVSVLAPRKVEVRWPASVEEDVVGYNLYRGLVTVGTNTTQAKSWGYNDPPYDQPVVDRVLDITGIEKLNARPIRRTAFLDESVDLMTKGPESADYRYAVYAYIVRAVNKLGTESGPSPYALTVPSEPRNLLLRERDGRAELKWDPAQEKGVIGYRVYRMDAQVVTRLTPEPIKETRFVYPETERARFLVTAVDALGQEGQPSSPAWCGQSYKGFYQGEWHQ